MTLFSMMCSSCLPLLNLRRKGLKPNTSVKSMNHPLFISFNWKKEGEKKTVLHRWDVWSLLFFFLLRPDEKKKESTKVSLFIHPPLSLSLSLSLSFSPSLSLSLWLWENRIGGETRSGTGRNQSGTPYTTARSHGSRKCPTPLPSSLSTVHHSLSLLSPVPPLVSLPLRCPPSPPIFTILPSTPAPSRPDTRHSAASQVSPFSSIASLLWWCCSAVVLTAHSFPCFPHSDLCSALGPPRNGSLPSLAHFSAVYVCVCVCASGRVCG